MTPVFEHCSLSYGNVMKCGFSPDLCRQEILHEIGKKEHGHVQKNHWFNLQNMVFQLLTQKNVMSQETYIGNIGYVNNKSCFCGEKMSQRKNHVGSDQSHLWLFLSKVQVWEQTGRRPNHKKHSVTWVKQ